MKKRGNSIPRREASGPRNRKIAGIGLLQICAFILLLAGCREEQDKTRPTDRLSIEYTIDRDAIMVGDPVELTVTAYYPTNGMLELPEIGYEKEVVVLHRDRQRSVRENGLTCYETRYSITSFRLGDHVVSTNAIRCTVGDREFTAKFPDVVLKVRTSLPEDASGEIADIKPARALPGRIPRWLWVVVGSAAVAFLCGLITARLMKKRKEEPPAPPTVPPHIVALNALQALRDKGLLEQNACEPFYTELSLILRTYLEGRFRLKAPDETTEEIVEEMSRSPELSGVHRNILQDFMRQADIIKFARGHTERTAMESAFETTRQFVEETRIDATETEVQGGQA